MKKLLIYMGILAHTGIVQVQLRMSQSTFRNIHKFHIFEDTGQAQFFVPRNKIGSSYLKWDLCKIQQFHWANHNQMTRMGIHLLYFESF